MRGRVELKTTFRVRPYTEILNGSMPKEGSQQIIGFFYNADLLRLEHGKVLADEFLPEPRKHQVLLIKKVDELLTKEEPARDELEKRYILTSMITLIGAEITEAYGESILDPKHVEGTSYTCLGGKLGHGSDFFRRSLTNIDRIKGNDMDSHDMEVFMSIAKQFIESYVYDNGTSTGKFKLDDPFSSIEGVDVPYYLQLCNNVIHEAANKTIQQNVKQKEMDKRRKQAEEEEILRKEHQAQIERMKASAPPSDAQPSYLGSALTGVFGFLTSKKADPQAAKTTLPVDSSKVVNEGSNPPVGNPTLTEEEQAKITLN
ncbi:MULTISPECIES: hypothetical protein [Legionella]|uniref:Dot/Icm T4SS effector n=1 Tax=Legionella maceachernii TaxID=466 RepID=A0A0W0VX74_9GAMM|nr:hypothetical protein [Legionella maceachernii]KTD24530.1 hypothetical protein Lmac_2617 [Legionella maceachernii]SJZ61748.1 Substrate of the Dot/Icm secretion system, putative [Legionella maceachernii]SUP00923.1 Uncharacterised protein [Legionella maceachernii]